jgi:hypothetical protein
MSALDALLNQITAVYGKNGSINLALNLELEGHPPNNDWSKKLEWRVRFRCGNDRFTSWHDAGDGTQILEALGEAVREALDTSRGQ